MAPSGDDLPSKERRVAFAVGLLFYVVLISVTWSKDVHTTLIAAFGGNPFGFDVRLVVAAFETILFLPLFPVFRAPVPIQRQAALDREFSLSFFICLMCPTVIHTFAKHVIRSGLELCTCC